MHFSGWSKNCSNVNPTVHPVTITSFVPICECRNLATVARGHCFWTRNCPRMLGVQLATISAARPQAVMAAAPRIQTSLASQSIPAAITIRSKGREQMR